MISVAEADRLLSDFAAGSGGLWPAESVPLEDAAGRILREDLRADRAYPAQDRSYMDGIAIAFAAWEMGVRRFPVAGLAPAGAPRARLDAAAGCIEIMTGAVLPHGADCIVPYEETTRDPPESPNVPTSPAAVAKTESVTYYVTLSVCLVCCPMSLHPVVIPISFAPSLFVCGLPARRLRWWAS